MPLASLERVTRGKGWNLSFLMVVSAAVVIGSEAFVARIASSAHEVTSAPSSPRTNKTMCFTKKETEEIEGNVHTIDRQTWNPLRLAVLKIGLTEPAWTSPFNYQKKQGMFKCAYCGKQLFDSTGKYDSGSGWPSFWRTASDGSVALKREFDGRVECRCQKCGSHLGHVFMDGPAPSDVSRELLETAPSTDPRTASGNRLPRYCINGAALMFDEAQREGEKSNNE